MARLCGVDGSCVEAVGVAALVLPGRVGLAPV
jgi:hypothetical protein